MHANQRKINAEVEFKKVIRTILTTRDVLRIRRCCCMHERNIVITIDVSSSFSFIGLASIINDY